MRHSERRKVAYTLILSTGQSESSSASNSSTMRNNALSTVKVGRDAPEGILKETQFTGIKIQLQRKLHTRMAQLKENVRHCSNAQCLPLHQ